MRIPGKYLSLLLVGVAWAIVLPPLAAEETAPPAPSPQAAPTAAEPAPYPLDLPDLPPRGNGTGLFPDGPRQNPPASTAPGASRTRRKSLVSGVKQRGRSRDRTLQQADSDPLTVRVAYRREKTVALAHDPGLSDLLREADAARTDVQKRAFLRTYYARLFASIRRLDASPEMKVHLALLAQVAKQRYQPTRRAVAGEEELLNTRESTGNQRLGR